MEFSISIFSFDDIIGKNLNIFNSNLIHNNKLDVILKARILDININKYKFRIFSIIIFKENKIILYLIFKINTFFCHLKYYSRLIKGPYSNLINFTTQIKVNNKYNIKKIII